MGLGGKRLTAPFRGFGQKSKITIEMKFTEKKYGLSFLIPSGFKDGYTTLCQLTSDTPFPTISKGDLIDPRSWGGKPFEEYIEKFEYGRFTGSRNRLSPYRQR